MANMANTNNGYHVLHDNNSETGMFFQLDRFFFFPSSSHFDMHTERERGGS